MCLNIWLKEIDTFCFFLESLRYGWECYYHQLVKGFSQNWMISVMDWMLVFSQNTYLEILTSQVMGSFWGGTCKLWGWSPNEQNLPLCDMRTALALCSLPSENERKLWPPANHGGVLPRHRCVITLNLDFTVSKTVRKKRSLFKLPCLWYFVSQRRLRQFHVSILP